VRRLGQMRTPNKDESVRTAFTKFMMRFMGVWHRNDYRAFLVVDLKQSP